MTSELRKELERQYDRAVAEAAKKEQEQQICPPAEDEFLLPPRSYKKEYAECFKSLPPEMRRYLHERESETEKGFSRLNNELNNRRWLDDAFSARSARLGRLGICKAKDWVETMAKIDDDLEKDPFGTLQTLAKAYGVHLGASVQPSAAVDVAPLLERLEELNSKFSRFVDEFRAKTIEEEQIAESKKAKEASFSPKGKNSNRDLSKLTTREVLELKLADYE